ncbi:MAG: hypothetical protein KZQ93_03280 [Candidatus Thiodiazotropha sp. (ex Monitilora ramsayi)]|nr:hypothetical protein [Candidatus Thiodiazotropha sp. (ex Monitilora ramsayi)]
MHSSLRQLCCTVQKNCHISDARHGTDYGLCTYLLKMREFYRWEHGIDFNTALTNESVGEWLTAREALWESLSEDDFSLLPLQGMEFDPFDVESLNAHLEPLGLVYSAGYGLKNKPLFFLGHLERREEPGGVTVWVAGRELARDLMAPAAMCQGDRIYIRQESFRRLLWEKLESWRWHRPDNALGRAFANYDFERDLEGSLDEMAERELDAVLLHEQGEYHAGLELGQTWNDFLSDLGHSPAELMARAVRDHWADCCVTLPVLIERRDRASIHFYFGSLSGMRETLFPDLAAAYEQWHSSDDWLLLEESVSRGEDHWSSLAAQLLQFRELPVSEAKEAVKNLVEANIL